MYIVDIVQAIGLLNVFLSENNIYKTFYTQFDLYLHMLKYNLLYLLINFPVEDVHKYLQWDVLPVLANFWCQSKHTSMRAFTQTHTHMHKGANGNQYVHCDLMMSLTILTIKCDALTIL